MNKKFSAILLSALLANGCVGEDSSMLEGPLGKADVVDGSREAAAVLALVNSPDVDFDELDDDAKLTSTAARAIIEHRDGADEQPGTSDDDLFESVEELLDLSGVGPSALERLLEYAIAQGFMGGGVDAIMSPQPSDTSHNNRAAQMIRSAKRRVDIMSYRLNDSKIKAALEEVMADGVEVRLLYEVAKKHKNLPLVERASSRSAMYEDMGINVRYVNKINHHKSIIVDGPTEALGQAQATQIASGSANFNSGGAAFDENTLFVSGNVEAALRMQREFNLLWENSKDFVHNTNLPFELSELEITDAMLEANDDPNFDVLMTSDNFVPNNNSFKTVVRDSVNSQWVDAIMSADESIHMASGHLRSRPIAEALIARAEEDPSLDIRIYLDGQEYLSATSHSFQVADMEECLDEATTATQERNCKVKSFLFGFQVGDTPGIDVRYKYYAYRWNHSYADQMHHKYMIIDGDELYTGSYNLSDNAEHNSFENVFVFRGSSYAGVIAQYDNNFETIYDTAKNTTLLSELQDEIDSGGAFPIVFPAMALEHTQIRNLKGDILDACPDVNSQEFRQNPASHRSCTP